LQSGAIDAVEFLGPFSDRALGLDQIADNYYAPGFNKPNGTAEALINANLWASLSPDLRAAVQNACDAENDAGLAEATWFNAQALQALTQQGTVIGVLPDDIVDRAREVSQQVLADFAETNGLTRRVQQSYDQAMGILSAWDGVQKS